MNRLFRLVFFLFFVIFYTGSADAAIHLDHAILEQAIASGSESKYLETIYQSQLDSGVKNFIPLSLLLINASKQLLAGGDQVSAQVCADYAVTLSPDFSAARMNRDYISWRTQPWMVYCLATGVIQTILAKFKTPEEGAFFVFVQLASLGAALMITLAGIGTISLVRNCRLLVHDLRHILPTALPAHTSVALVIALCILPLLFGLSLAWLFPYWLMLFWSYHNVRERACIGIAVIGFVFVMPLIAAGCSLLLFIPQSEIVQRLWQANYGYYTHYDIEKLEQDIFNNPDSYDLLFSAGLVNKREQNYGTAMRYYDRLLKKNPRDYRVCVNAGNVYFAIGEWEKAVEKYKTAIESAPGRSAAAHFNLMRAYQQKFMFKDAEKCLADAKRLDTARVENYLNLYTENFNRLLMDETITLREIWEQGFDDFSKHRNLLNSIWDLLFAGLRLPFGTLAVLGLLILNLVFSVRDTLRVAAKCTLCGRIMCLRCQRTIAADVLCFQCQNFLKKQDQLSFKQKDVKKTQIHAYIGSFRRWIALFSIFMPGMAHVFKGRFISGCLWCFLFFWLLNQAIFALFFRGLWYDVSIDWVVYSFFFALISALVWIILRSHVRAVRSPELEDNISLLGLGIEP